MTRTTHSLRYTSSAIAAALAFGSTAGHAQDPAAPFPASEPVIVVPDIPAPVAPAPTVVVPADPVPVPEPETAVEADEPVAAQPPAAAVSRTRAPTARAPAPVRSAAVAAPEPAPAIETEVPPADTAVVAAAPLEPAAATDPTPANTSNDAGLIALGLGGLAFLGLAIWGFVAIGRRKPVRRYVAEAGSPTVAAAVPAPPVAQEVQPVSTPEIKPSAPAFAPRPTLTGALPHAGASVALPAKLPEDFGEREALFRRLVDARPDRANPFTDRKARMKRARLIMQSIGRDFGHAEPWIDLSQYPNNWPELAHRRSAAA